MEKVFTMMFYWVYKSKIKHWNSVVNYNNCFHAECHNWLQNQQVQLGGFDADGQPMHVEVDETYFFHRKQMGSRNTGMCQ